MRSFIIVICIFFAFNLFGQKGKKITRSEYIEAYKDIAMREMKRVGIPASITLAQGLLESGNGNSELAIKANNHFGIKCHDWKGPSVKYDDDRKNECFRKYRSPEKSYQDHSDFLTNRQRYAFLFELKENDYKAWAKGLKKAGYATSSSYASALIKIIEENELYKYDKEVLGSSKGRSKGKSSIETYEGNREILFNNRVKYVVADSGDTYESISEELHMFSWQLPKYNEQASDKKLKKGEFIYIQPKRNKASGANKSHMVAKGETLHSIAQVYGIKEEKLRSRNNLGEKDEPEVGAVLLLGGHLKSGALPIKTKNTEPKRSKEKQEFEIEFDLGS